MREHAYLAHALPVVGKARAAFDTGNLVELRVDRPWRGF
jgi:hypothetical protein